MTFSRVVLTIAAGCFAATACGDAFTSDPDGNGAGGEANGLAPEGGAAPSTAAGIGAGSTEEAGASAMGTGGDSAQGAGGHGGSGGSDDGAAGDPTPGGAGSPSTGPDCQKTDDCPSGQNCIQHACVPALVSCAAQKNSYPDSPDGVYWISSSGTVQRAYCDMRLSTELCSEIVGEHRGRTRDEAAIDYTMSSVLLLSEGVCKLWAIRGTDTGHPFEKLVAVEGVPAGYTCRALGFAGDGELGMCDYGSQHSSCGFTATPLHIYGNNCSGCTLNDGAFDRWTLQGPVIIGSVLSSMTGTTFTTCKTQ